MRRKRNDGGMLLVVGIGRNSLFLFLEGESTVRSLYAPVPCGKLDFHSGSSGRKWKCRSLAKKEENGSDFSRGLSIKDVQ